MSDGLPTLECGEGTGVDEIDELLSIRAAELYYEENKTCLLYTSPSPRDS